MFRNYLLVALRIIDRQRMYSALNIVGLAIGMAAFLLIALYTQFELGFDRYHDHAERIYRIVREGRTLTPPPLGTALQDNFDEVEAVARIIQDENTLVSRDDKHFLEKNFYWAGPGIFEIFSFEFVRGSAETALAEPSSIVISESTAQKYFGEDNPLGKNLNIDDIRDFRVTGVFADMPANSHFIMDALVPYLDYFRGTDLDMTSWNSNYTYTYFLLREDADPRALEKSIHEVIEIPLLEKFNVPKPWPDNFYFAQPITDIHLKSHREQEISVNNDIGYVLLFASIAVLVLFIACINYVNLTTAKSVRRGREVGMRKVVGASRLQLVQQFMGESFFLILLALGLTLAIVNLALPAFADLVERPLSMAAMLEPKFLLVLVATLALVALLAGGYPAISISGFKPATILKGSLLRGSSGKTLRNVLVLFQFSVTIALFICTLTVNRQLEFVNGYDVGYSKDNIINLRIRDKSVRANVDTVKSELLQHPNVLAVAASGRLPNDIDGFTSRALNPRLPQQETTIYYNTADYDFIELFDIQIVQGRNFSREQVSDEQGVFLVNEAAVRAGNWDNPLEQTMEHWSGETGRVVGVMKDFHLHSLHSAIEPLYIFLAPEKFAWLSVKVKPTDLPATLAHLEQVMKDFSPNFPFEYTFFDQEFARAYQAEQKMGNVFSSFAVLAIIVACLGLFGLSAFTAQQRTREIGIRKVMGASVARITMLLSSEFMRWVVIA
ncbi:MAG: ABC transporter permease, partial [Xanthomonadales bacterium]|nr:ABC transporter permease [Xanthomonadales bacterium]